MGAGDGHDAEVGRAEPALPHLLSHVITRSTRSGQEESVSPGRARARLRLGTWSFRGHPTRCRPGVSRTDARADNGLLAAHTAPLHCSIAARLAARRSGTRSRGTTSTSHEQRASVRREQQRRRGRHARAQSTTLKTPCSLPTAPRPTPRAQRRDRSPPRSVLVHRWPPIAKRSRAFLARTVVPGTTLAAGVPGSARVTTAPRSISSLAASLVLL